MCRLPPAHLTADTARGPLRRHTWKQGSGGGAAGSWGGGSCGEGPAGKERGIPTHRIKSRSKHGARKKHIV